MKKIAVILSGCGNRDGSELQESLSLLLAIDRRGWQYQCFAPEGYFEVVPHIDVEETEEEGTILDIEQRDIFVESARIARGNLLPIEEYKSADYDALALPGGMGAARTGQLQQTIDRLKADTPREEALKKIEAKDKDAYAKIQKSLDEANAKLAELAKKAEVELPDTAEQQKAKTLEFLAKEKDAIDKLLETDKTDSASAMRSFNELAQKNNITIAPAARGGMAGMPGAMGPQQPPTNRGAQGGARSSTSTIRQIQEKFPEEYKEAQKLREDDPAAYREKMRELQAKLNAAK